MDWSERYSTPLAAVWSRENKLRLEWRVEVALLRALEGVGRVPAGAGDAVEAVCASGRVTLARTLEIEKETHHDIMAMVKAVAEACPEYGGYIHYGATSQDVNDTVTALQLTECQRVLGGAVTDVRRELTRLAATYRDVASIGRTHGQHAIPITMGFKFANFLYEMSVAGRMLERVEVRPKYCVSVLAHATMVAPLPTPTHPHPPPIPQVLAKFSGAVGTYASLGTAAVQASIMRQLGLTAAPISTQVVSRLHNADFLFACAAIAAAAERLAKELRNLQRSEIDETCEGFGARQVGSSTMPQKRNPHKSERICGVARIVRAQLDPGLETVPLEHERDLTNSSTERITLPTATVLTHYLLSELRGVLAALEVDTAAVARNLRAGGGRQLAERIMLALAGKVGRQVAHEILRKHTAADDFVAALKADATVAAAFTDDELTALLDPTTYIGLAPTVVDDILTAYGVPAAPVPSAAGGAGSDAAAAAAASGGAGSDAPVAAATPAAE